MQDGRLEPGVRLPRAMRLGPSAFPLAAVAVVAALAFAGCSSSPGNGMSMSPSPSSSPVMTATVGPPTSGSYNVMAHNVPATVAAGTTFTIQVHIEGNETRHTNHIGAHFGPSPSDAPSTTVYPSACVHQEGDLPGMYDVQCTAPTDKGTYYLRGHARYTNADGTQVNWWSSEVSFQVT
jgi:hypothetical protein